MSTPFNHLRDALAMTTARLRVQAATAREEAKNGIHPRANNALAEEIDVAVAYAQSALDRTVRGEGE